MTCYYCGYGDSVIVKVLKVIILFCLLAIPSWADLAAGYQSLDKGDYSAALKEFLPLARQGDSSAQWAVGFMHEQGHGVPRDYKEAIKWYRLAAEQGATTAQFDLGFAYAYGRGVGCLNGFGKFPVQARTVTLS
jgi:TPR repeat protein